MPPFARLAAIPAKACSVQANRAGGEVKGVNGQRLTCLLHLPGEGEGCKFDGRRVIPRENDSYSRAAEGDASPAHIGGCGVKRVH